MNQHNQYPPCWPSSSSGGGRPYFSNNRNSQNSGMAFNYAQRGVRFGGSNNSMAFDNSFSQHPQHYQGNTFMSNRFPSSNQNMRFRAQNNTSNNRNFSPRFKSSQAPLWNHRKLPRNPPVGTDPKLKTSPYPPKTNSYRNFSPNVRSVRSPPRNLSILTSNSTVPKGPRTPPYPPPDSPSNEASSSHAEGSPKKLLHNQTNTIPNSHNVRKNVKQKKISEKSKSSTTKSKKSSPEKKYKPKTQPSPLNAAVQEYLLQVLTAKPQSVSTQLDVPSQYALPSAALLSQPPPPLNTPPPLPPTPEAPPLPPLPAEEETEKIDTVGSLIANGDHCDGTKPTSLEGDNQPKTSVDKSKISQEPTAATEKLCPDKHKKPNTNMGKTSLDKSKIDKDPVAGAKELPQEVENQGKMSVDKTKVNNSHCDSTKAAILQEVNQPKSSQEVAKVAVTKIKLKNKRRKLALSKNAKNDWNFEDAQLALKTEEELSKDYSKETVLHLRFPDPPLNREIVQNYSDAIDSVHFHQNSAPRYCFVYLKEGVDVQEVMNTISKIPFGNGFVSAEIRKIIKPNDHENKKIIDNIDPYTLYVGNLSPTVMCKVLKEKFPGSARIDIGYAQRLKSTRYAFIRYHNVADAIAAYRNMVNTEIEGRSLIIRFRRFDSVSKEDILDNTLHEDETNADAFSTISDGSLHSVISGTVIANVNNEPIEKELTTTREGESISQLSQLNNDDVALPKSVVDQKETEQSEAIESEMSITSTIIKVAQEKENQSSEDFQSNSTAPRNEFIPEREEDIQSNSTSPRNEFIPEREEDISLLNNNEMNNSVNFRADEDPYLNPQLNNKTIDIVKENTTESSTSLDAHLNTCTIAYQTTTSSEPSEDQASTEYLNTNHDVDKVFNAGQINKSTSLIENTRDTDLNAQLNCSKTDFAVKQQNESTTVSENETLDQHQTSNAKILDSNDSLNVEENVDDVTDKELKEPDSIEVSKQIESRCETDASPCSDSSQTLESLGGNQLDSTQITENDLNICSPTSRTLTSENTDSVVQPTLKNDNIVDDQVADMELSKQTAASVVQPIKNHTVDYAPFTENQNETNNSGSNLNIECEGEKECSSIENNISLDIDMERDENRKESGTEPGSGCSTNFGSDIDNEARSGECITNNKNCANKETEQLQNLHQDNINQTMVPNIEMENIKSEHNAEDDMVANNVETLEANCNLRIKEEPSRFDEDYEFYSVCGSSHNEKSSTHINSANEDINSIASENSNSSCDLNYFLRLCESSHDSGDEGSDRHPPPTKKLRIVENKQLAKSMSKEKETPNEVKLEKNADEDLTLVGTLRTQSDSTKSRGNFISNIQQDTETQIKQECLEDAIDNDILTIDSDDAFLSAINIKSEDEESVINNSQSMKPKSNSNHSENNEDDDDDIVPPNAFSVPSTPLQSNVLLNPLQIKEEWDVDAGARQKDSKMLTRSNKVDKKELKSNILKDKANSNKSTTFSRGTQSKKESKTPQRNTRVERPVEDDDLVPADNALNSRSKSLGFCDLTWDDDDDKTTVVVIKTERETEDLFLLPTTAIKKKSNESREKPTETISRKETNIKKPTHRSKGIHKNSCTTQRNIDQGRKSTKATISNDIIDCTDDGSDDDDDVIIVSCDNGKAAKTTSFPKPMPCSQTLVGEVKRETSTPDLRTTKKNSFFGESKKSNSHGDNLDRLFKLLDSDSDEEL
ncbi:uncharacterized protein LOC101889630 [Musca domestica]|uniref:Uncharacterized protein LOC101889630 n=1 Tax=Musca domestica TaxID=7370 RepID=A0A1I8MU55_MUSDO|nr:uncharacterized protein LOC101889630 [Musca domestica]